MASKEQAKKKKFPEREKNITFKIFTLKINP